MKLLSPQELEAALRDIGARRYHRLHPFHHLLHGGKCTKGQVQAWALNRYYYQAMIPIKDASLIARCLDSDIRREWRRRLVDHDGEKTGEGGIARWLKLTSGLGLDRTYVTSLAGILPASRFAVDAYVHFVREKTLLEAIASSLTELFSPTIISERMEGMLKNYKFVTSETMAYFSARPPQAREDSDFALAYVKEHAKTAEQQILVLAALEFKCDILWAMLDALYAAYVDPKLPPPGAFIRRKINTPYLAAEIILRVDLTHDRPPQLFFVAHEFGGLRGRQIARVSPEYLELLDHIGHGHDLAQVFIDLLDNCIWRSRRRHQHDPTARHHTGDGLVDGRQIR